MLVCTAWQVPLYCYVCLLISNMHDFIWFNVPSIVAPPPLPRVHALNSHQRTSIRAWNTSSTNNMVADQSQLAANLNQTTSTDQFDSASNVASRSQSAPQVLLRHPSLEREGNIRPNFRRSFHRTTSPSPQRYHADGRNSLRNTSLDRSSRQASGSRVSPAGSVTSLNSASSRASSRQSLVIVPPRNRSGRSEIRQGEITTKRVRSVSATQELKVTAPPALHVKLSG